MLWTFVVFSVLYYLFVVFLITFWNRETVRPEEPVAGEYPLVSVVIAVRNEEETIGCLIDGLAHQQYPADRFEVIIVDDGSMDDTLEVVQAKGRHLSCELKIGISGTDQITGSGKKAALSKGIEMARGELIMVTDGDCRVGSQWISVMSAWFLKQKADFLAGPVSLKVTGGFWQSLQALEFASLTGAAGAFLQAGKPLFCNGANMAFTIDAYDAVEGHARGRMMASGDDVYLMQSIHASGRKVSFVKDIRALVQTMPLSRWHDFFHQRNRWAGKWNKFQGVFALLLPVFLFFYYLIMVTALIFAIVGWFNWLVFLFLIAVKVIVDYIYLKKVVNFLRNKLNIGIFVLASLGYAFYALFFGISSNLTGFQWKGRKYRR